jgi:hypothetical protein
MTSYLVQCGFTVHGTKRPYWAERDETDTSYEATLLDLITAQLENPLRVIELDEDGIWRDVSEDIAEAILLRLDDLPRGQGLRDFLEENACEAYREFAREKEAA